jgi:hypothetical protein
LRPFFAVSALPLGPLRRPARRGFGVQFLEKVGENQPFRRHPQPTGGEHRLAEPGQIRDVVDHGLGAVCDHEIVTDPLPAVATGAPHRHQRTDHGVTV